MVITPIASAFDHCSGMDMHGRLSESQIQLVADIDDIAGTVKNTEPGQGQDQNQVEMHCHGSVNCTFHVCGSCGIAASTSFSDFIAFYNYPITSPLLPYNTFFAPAIRPPILIL
jgi:hypothetical protein